MKLTLGHDKSILNVPSIDHVRVSDGMGDGCVRMTNSNHGRTRIHLLRIQEY